MEEMNRREIKTDRDEYIVQRKEQRVQRQK